MRFLWLLCLGVGGLGVACATSEWAPFQNLPASTSRPSIQKRTLPNTAIARVHQWIGPPALLHSKAQALQHHPLAANEEIFLGDAIETPAGTFLELQLAPFVETPSLVRMSENTKGYFLLAPHPDSDKEELAFALGQGKILLYANLLMTVQTPKAKAAFSNSTALLSHDAQGFWLGALVGNTQIFLSEGSVSSWNVILAPGEQMLPLDIGNPALNLSPIAVQKILTTSPREQRTLPYPLNTPIPSSPYVWKLSHITKTEPLLARFEPLPTGTLVMLKRWMDLQENRWNQYVYERNQQRRDRLAQNNRYR